MIFHYILITVNIIFNPELESLFLLYNFTMNIVDPGVWYLPCASLNESFIRIRPQLAP